MRLLQTTAFEAADWTQLLLLLQQEVTFANAQLQVHSRIVAAEMDRLAVVVGGVRIEPAEQLPAMGLKQISFRFFVEAVPRRWPQRLRAFLLRRPVATTYRFGSPQSSNAAQVEVVVDRSDDGSFRAQISGDR